MKGRKFWGHLTIVILFILLGSGTSFLITLLNQPFGQTMTLDVQPTATVKSGEVVPTAVARQANPVALNKHCGESGAMNLLIIGTETGEGVYVHGADLIRVLRVDFSNQKVTIFAFPRDLWVPTKALSDLNIDASLLGSVFEKRYLATESDKSQSPDKSQDIKRLLAGTSSLAQVLVDSFGLVSDHYVIVKMDRMAGLLGTLGAMTINIPEEVVIDNRIFMPGKQTLTDDQVVAYVRYNETKLNDFERMARQNLVLDALHQELADPTVIAKIPDLYMQVKDAIITDLNPVQITNLTCMLKDVPADHIIKDEVRAEMVTNRPEGGLAPDMEAIHLLLKTMGMVQ